MPITSQATGEKYVPQSIETHPRRIELRQEAEFRRIELERIRSLRSVKTGPSTRKILLIIMAVALVSAAVGGGAAAAIIILTQNKSSTTTDGLTSTSSVTTSTNAVTSTSTGATTIPGVTTVPGATTTSGATTTAAAATTVSTTTSGTTIASGPRCPGTGSMPSVNQLGPSIEEHVSIFNNFTLSSIIVEIYSQRLAGVSAAAYTDFIDNQGFSIGSCARFVNTTFIRTRCTLSVGTTVAPQTGAEAISEINVPNGAYVGTGDTYFVTATCTNGSISTLTGTF